MSDEFQTAVEHLNKGEYEEAQKLAEQLQEEGYEDGAEYIFERIEIENKEYEADDDLINA